MIDNREHVALMNVYMCDIIIISRCAMVLIWMLVYKPNWTITFVEIYIIVWILHKYLNITYFLFFIIVQKFFFECVWKWLYIFVIANNFFNTIPNMWHWYVNLIAINILAMCVMGRMWHEYTRTQCSYECACIIAYDKFNVSKEFC